MRQVHLRELWRAWIVGKRVVESVDWLTSISNQAFTELFSVDLMAGGGFVVIRKLIVWTFEGKVEVSNSDPKLRTA